MRQIHRSGLIKAFAFALALIGVNLFGAPRSAQAAPAMVSTEIVAPASGLTEVRYGHHRHHYGHRHFGHRRHFGHHYGYGHRRHHFGRHFGHRHGRHFGGPRFY